MSDECKTITTTVVIQENGIIRRPDGVLLGRCDPQEYEMLAAAPASPCRESGEGEALDALRTIIGKLWEWHRANYKLAFPISPNEWGDFERILDSAVPTLAPKQIDPTDPYGLPPDSAPEMTRRQLLDLAPSERRAHIEKNVEDFQKRCGEEGHCWHDSQTGKVRCCWCATEGDGKMLSWPVEHGPYEPDSAPEGRDEGETAQQIIEGILGYSVAEINPNDIPATVEAIHNDIASRARAKVVEKVRAALWERWHTGKDGVPAKDWFDALATTEET